MPTTSEAPSSSPPAESSAKRVAFAPSTKGAPPDAEAAAADPPRSLRPLLSACASVPRLHVPGTDLDVSFTLASFLVLTFIRFLTFRLLLALGWPSRSKMTTDAAASLTSIVHSVALVWSLGVCLARHPKYVPSARLDAAPRWWQDCATALLEMCTGYMLFDSFFLVKDSAALGLDLSEFDMLVLAHHLVTSFYMTSVRVVGAGHLSAMMLMFLGEISNPLMNALFVTRFAIKLDCCNGPLVQDVHTVLEPAFAFVYVYFRIAIGPLAALHLTFDLLFTEHGRRNVPVLLSLVWVGMTWAVIYGSGPFIEDALDMLRDGFMLKYDADYDYGERYRIFDEL